jgi:hypothetical protein
MAFDINDDVDPDFAAFLAYTALQSAMTNYTGDEIDTVVRLTYLAPTPIEPSPATPPETRSSKKFSPFAIGACAAMVRVVSVSTSPSRRLLWYNGAFSNMLYALSFLGGGWSVGPLRVGAQSPHAQQAARGTY